MKIKTKLSIGYILLLLLLAGITSFGYSQLNQMNESINRFYDNRFEKVKIALAVRGEINSSGRLMNDIMLGDQAPAEAVAEIAARLSIAESQMARLSEMELTGSELALMSDIRLYGENYTRSVERFVEEIGNGRIEEAKALYAEQLRGEQRTLIDAMEELVGVQERALTDERQSAQETYDWSIGMVGVLSVVGLLLGVGIVLWVFPSITRGLNLLGKMADRFSKGRLKGFARMEIRSKDELGQLGQLFKRIALDLQEKNEREAVLSAIQQRQGRMNAQLARVTELLQEASDADAVAQAFIAEFAPAVGASHGLLYLEDPAAGDRVLKLSGAYALTEGEEGESLRSAAKTIQPGEGLTGQCYRDAKRIVVDDLPSGYVKIGSGLGSVEPKTLLIEPIRYDNEVIGVLELASVTEVDSDSRELLEALCEKLAAIVNNIRSRQRVEELLRESQAMTEELQVQSEELVVQQEELRETNDKLEKQQLELKKSEQRLQQQQEELEHANQELTVKTVSLEQHIERVEVQHRQIAQANAELERQALQLALTSKYKSEFLANMSHELRTPLNSLLILSEFLSENKEGNLNEQQREYLRTIHSSGSDLLKMIDEILDLSKVDAGRMEINPEWVVLDDVAVFLNHLFAPMAESKRLTLNLGREADIPDTVRTDGHRLKQIMRNLLSNAIKFTDSGDVTLSIRKPTSAELASDRKRDGVTYVALCVKDTGIGVPEDKREMIFEAFRQADGTTSRQYGGTGLGLTISRELAYLLGGWIHLETEQGKGSAFTLVVPEKIEEDPAYAESLSDPYAAEYSAAAAENEAAERAETGPADDRADLAPGDKVILIVEDDVNFAKVLMEMARSRGFKAVAAVKGNEGLELARTLKPDAIILDIQLPVTDGWSVLHALKDDPNTRHIPVHVVSVVEHSPQGLRMGAIDHLQKPATAEQLASVFEKIGKVLDRKPKRLLLVERDEDARRRLTDLIVHDDVDVAAEPDTGRAWERLRSEAFDCIVLDSGLPEDDSIDFLKRMQLSPDLRKIPVIVHGEEDDDTTLRKMRYFADAITLKDVKSPERLLEETALFLHRVESDLPEDKRKLLSKLHRGDETFENKKILLVDDDVRNVFALSSLLEHRNMIVVYAENGQEALAKLQDEPDVDLVLMDIMMPVMDGYEAMRRIRSNSQWSNLPVIALTAKAMKDDRNKCIEAGASDYITKPVNTDQLLSLMRVWLHR
ncbi:response regulator [Paenibacillaceae bacterium WGS1546]|uniref:response regulator n=1 Tax=Cohnella sp. WGS1546 TaxID=3366810 RepID=UPI00372D4F77